MKLKYIMLSVVALCSTNVWADDISYVDWMSQLPDTAKVRNLSIPGAHDAGSSGCTTIGGARTQTLSIADQWDSGLRAFDLRPNKDMKIYHGVASSNTDMESTFKSITTKLTDNAKDFAVFIIRYEEEADKGLLGTGSADREKFTANLKSLMDEYSDYIVEFSPSLKVKNVRGKIIMIVRDDFDSNLVASFKNIIDNRQSLGEQKNPMLSCGRTKVRIYVQDHYEYSDEAAKKEAIKNMVDESTNNTYYPMWVINNTSGYQGSSSSDSKVKTNATTMNGYLADYLTDNEIKGKTGIVMMDHAGDDTYNGQKLIDAIINQNKTYMTLNTVDPGIPTGIEEVDMDAADMEIYNISGVKVGKSVDALEPGVYVVRQGQKSTKMVIK